MACLFFSKTFAIEGTYLGGGYDPYLKKPYSIKLVISKDKNDVYQAVWLEQEEHLMYRYAGTGIKTGGQVNFVFQSSGGASDPFAGVQVYMIDGDTLEGPYVYINENIIGTEKVRKQL
jgi:hypothetical protein